ncbi:notochord granular surface isoform X2 [Oryzias melastigma]|uniref:notochord granular surface isoform X2 n=1 Tax=Oryzias melastigma TaxID=30732 RepID=UPI000CF7DB1E|nr:notochord granular surface isoform X2 [Oryzias melastigma]
MSRSPERMSSYRRCFEDNITSTSRLRVSSPSPTRGENRHRSASFNRSGGWKLGGHRALTKQRLTSSSMGVLCVGPSMEPGNKMDLDVAAAENQAFKLTRTNERQEMVVLNDRLTAYIEKVRSLESKNNLLEAEIEALKSSFERTSSLRQLYASQLKELNREAEQMREQRDSSLADKEAKLSQLDVLKAKYYEALDARKEKEVDIETLRPDVDKSTSARIKLEKQQENLEVELAFQQRVHKEEIEELMQQIYASSSKTDLTFDLPDLSSALMQIQSQYDSIAAKNLQEMDTWYKTKFHDMGHASTKHAESVRALREEIAGYRKDILNKERDLDFQKMRNEFLETQICEAKEKNKTEEENLQDQAESMNSDLKLTKEKVALLMREYQDLLNAKMALEIEITTYRKLIEGEDGRLSTVVGRLSLTDGLNTTFSPDTPALTGTLKLTEGHKETGGSSNETAAASGQLVADSKGTSHDQACAVCERKTLLIRKVKTDEDTYVSNTKQCTITISGAAEDTDEE